MRIATEALTNVRKHARATDVEITLTTRGGRLRLEIADNGRGFNPRSRTDGFGIVGMRERASALGGRLRISRASRKPGTRVTLVVAPPAGCLRTKGSRGERAHGETQGRAEGAARPKAVARSA